MTGSRFYGPRVLLQSTYKTHKARRARPKKRFLRLTWADDDDDNDDDVDDYDNDNDDDDDKDDDADDDDDDYDDDDDDERRATAAVALTIMSAGIVSQLFVPHICKSMNH